MEVRARLVGANEAAAGEFDAASGFVAFRGGYERGTVIHSVTATSVEDFVAFEDPGAAPELHYALDLFEGVAGLRLVSNTLEFLDRKGAPRLRVAPPFIIDSNSKRHPAELELMGCSADTNPAAPWGRPVVAPGVGRCELVVRWHNAAPAYPLLVDPAWQSTKSMATPRSWHTTTLLKDGLHVLAAGGTGPAAGVSSEIYDVASDTWAATGSPGLQRDSHTATLLNDGTVLIAGGILSGNQITNTAMRYFPNGKWSPAAPMSTAHLGHAALLVGDDVFVIAGIDSFVGVLAPKGANERFSAATGQWNTLDSLAHPRYNHTATELTDGRIVVAGGVGANNLVLTDVEVIVGTIPAEFTQLNQARLGHSATLLSNGKLLLVGGESAFGMPSTLATSEVLDPATGKWSFFGGDLLASRAFVPLVSLANGCILTAGGKGGPSDLAIASTELLDVTKGIWVSSTALLGPREGHGLIGLPDGRVFLTGGEDDTKMERSETAAFALGKEGDSCASDCECGDATSCVSGMCCKGADPPGTACTDSCSCAGGIKCVAGVCCDGFAVDGVCCKTKCDGLCEKCGADGVCAPSAEGTDPDNDCVDQTAISCKDNGVCDGKGACEQYKKGTACGKNGCDGATLLSAECNGGGDCISTSIACAPFLCDSSASSCFGKCKSIDDCSAPNVCDNGTCVAPPTDQAGGGAVETGGCGCTLPGRDERPLHLGVIALAGLVALRLRSRRRQPGAR